MRNGDSGARAGTVDRGAGGVEGGDYLTNTSSEAASVIVEVQVGPWSEAGNRSPEAARVGCVAVDPLIAAALFHEVLQRISFP